MCVPPLRAGAPFFWKFLVWAFRSPRCMSKIGVNLCTVANEVTICQAFSGTPFCRLRTWDELVDQVNYGQCADTFTAPLPQRCKVRVSQSLFWLVLRGAVAILALVHVAKGC